MGGGGVSVLMYKKRIDRPGFAFAGRDMERGVDTICVMRNSER